jgi:galactokinase
LIGEHIDYCGGLVLPMAIDRGTRAVAAKNNDGLVRIFSERFGEEKIIPLRPGSAAGHWSDFAVGVVSLLSPHRAIVGVDIYVTDNISAGGLSSSASFSLLLSHILLWAADDLPTDIESRLELARMCQKVEHEFIGVNCGIMDQASIALGGIVVLDCANLTFETVAVDFSGYSLLVMDTQHQRALAGSKYKERVKEIAQISTILSRQYDICNLCDLSFEELDNALSLVDDSVLRRRLTHVVSENERVTLAVSALRDGNLAKFGELMDQSHQSLREDYEVTGDALDTIVRISQQQRGTLGARMTGAGFGGCALALVASDDVPAHNANIADKFEKATGVTPKIFSVLPKPAVGIV